MFPSLVTRDLNGIANKSRVMERNDELDGITPPNVARLLLSLRLFGSYIISNNR